MTNDLSNAPMPVAPMPEPGRPGSFFQTWIDAVTKPRETTYAAIANSPKAKLSTALLWVFIGSLVSAFFSILVPGPNLDNLRRLLQQQGLGDQFGNAIPQAGGFGPKIFQVICGAPIAAAISVVGFLIGVALIQWVAKMFGGHGTLDKLAYTLAAVTAPFSIISGIMALLGAIPYIGFCFGLITLALSIYILVLEIMATKAVNGFASYGPAIGSVLIPGLVIFLLCCCLAVGLFTLVGAALGNVMSQLGPLPFPTP